MFIGRSETTTNAGDADDADDDDVRLTLTSGTSENEWLHGRGRPTQNHAQRTAGCRGTDDRREKLFVEEISL